MSGEGMNAGQSPESLADVREAVRDATDVMTWVLPLVIAVRAWRDTPRTTRDMRLGQRLELAILDAINNLDEYAQLEEPVP